MLPNKIIRFCEETPLVSQLFITDIGFYPKAKFHYRERTAGSSQHILLYCIDGKGWVQFREKRVDVARGQYLVIPASTPHKYGSDESDPWSIHWMHFTGEASPHFVKLLNKEKTPVATAVHFSDERIRLFDTLYSRLESGYGSENLGYISMCLWHFLSSFCYADHFQAPFNREEKDAIDQSIEFMQQNLHRALSLQEMASEAHISPSHYSALFKKKTGYPPLEYFNHIKVQKACQYLQFTNLQVKEIAYKLGVNDPFYFSRFFSNIMGMSPLEYRNRKQAV